MAPLSKQIDLLLASSPTKLQQPDASLARDEHRHATDRSIGSRRLLASFGPQCVRVEDLAPQSKHKLGPILRLL